MTQNTTVVPFVKSGTLQIELPRNLGTLNLRPVRSNYMQVTSPGLLINDRVYSLSGGVVKTRDHWYFMDKVEIGVTGGRPSPKAAEEALKVIVGALNASIENDPEFQGRLTEIAEKERITRAEVERRRLLSEYGNLRKNVRRDLHWIEEAEERLRNARKTYEQSQVTLVEFMGQHPEIVEEADQNDATY